jgi:MSHA biogenesis protein MshL
MRSIHVFSIATLIVLLPACGSRVTALRTSHTDTAYENAPGTVAQSKPNTTTPPPAAVTEALMPKFNDTVLEGGSGLSASKSTGAPTFNISVHDVDAREFFMSLVVDSHENMVVHPDVSGHITLELKDVNVAQVLSTVQKVYGYDYTRTDIGYLIYPASLQTKIFKIDRLDMLREGSSNTRVSSGQINNNNNRNGMNGMNGMSGGANMSGGMGATGANGMNGMNNLLTSGSWITTTTKTDFWDELQRSLSAIVDVEPVAAPAQAAAMPGIPGGDLPSGGEMRNLRTGSRVVLNKQTGIVVVRANPSQMREVEKLISSTQGQISRQVVIEAKVLEVVLNDSHQDGINWADVLHNGQYALMSSVVGLPALAALNPQSAFTIPITFGDFGTFVELLEGQGKTNILSSPRISSLNNQKAVIKVGQDEYFITNVSSNNLLSSSASTVTQDITWTPFFSGVALDVTPQIADSSNVTLHIHPSVTRVSQEDRTFEINGENNSIPMALNVVRESDSVVHAQNGQIIVIGGLMDNEYQENKTGISLLAGIPYLGNAFRENKGSGLKRELVILLKPTIINSSEDWQGPLNSGYEQAQQLEHKQLWK